MHLRFHPRAPIPLSMMQDRAFLLTSRRTLFAMHRTARDVPPAARAPPHHAHQRAPPDPLESCDRDASKTSLIAFANPNHAVALSRIITDLHRHGSHLDRALRSSAITSVSGAGSPAKITGPGAHRPHGASIAPLLVRSHTVRELQALCMSNFWDLLLVYALEEELVPERPHESGGANPAPARRDAPAGAVDLECYEFTNRAYPGRAVLDRALEGLLRGR